MAKAKVDANAITITKDGVAAIETLGTFLASDGKGLVKALRPALALFSTRKEAEIMFLKAAAIAAEKRNKANKGNAPKAVAYASPQRISGCYNMLKAKEWNCWPQFLDNLEAVDPAWDTMVNLCNWFRSDKLALDKKTGTAPSVADINAFLSAKREKRAKTEKPKGIDAVRADQPGAVATTIETLGFLAVIEGAGIGGDFIANAVKALTAYRDHVKARATEEAAVIEKALAEHRAKTK